MYIHRTLETAIDQHLFQGKAVIVIGARQVGKSTMLEHIVATKQLKTLRLNGDEPETMALLTNPSATEIKALIDPYEIIFIDEAQRIENIGLTLKRIVDNYPQKQLLVTGSSTFELHNRLNEALTGRRFEYFLYPLSTKEIYDTEAGPLKVRQMLAQRLITGSYPDVINHPAEAEDYLLQLTDSYLYKDILMLDDLRRAPLLDTILKALALQVGSEVSYNELSRLVGASQKTVEKYIDLLEKCFVIFRLPALSRNVRNELKKTRKIFFYDNGVRNAVIQNFAPLGIRQDVGALWENFFISERVKFNNNRGHRAAYYFWRTTNRQEVDLIEESDGRLTLFEMKYNPGKTATFPKALLESYDIGDKAVITPDNYVEWLT